MLDEFDFHLLQTRYAREAMNDFANFRPDDLTIANVDALIAGAGLVRTAYLDAKTDYDLAMGGRNSTISALHDACVSVFGIMKTRFRKDAISTEVIAKLPVDDRTAAETLKRGQSISILWGKLPHPPGSVAEFKAWDTMDQDAFDDLVTAADTQLNTFTSETDDFEEAQGNLHAKDAELADFITAALAQGRHQFAPGTPQRELIDKIPTTPAQQAPTKAVITAATSPAAHEAHLEFDAPHATSFDVLHKAPGATTFTLVAEDTLQNTYNATALAPGAHDYKIIGRNSRGTGPASDVSTVPVA